METKAVVVKLPGYGAVEVKIRGGGARDATPLTPRLVGLVSRTQDNSEGLKKAERIAGAVLSLALYLCCQGAEIGDGTRRPGFEHEDLTPVAGGSFIKLPPDLLEIARKLGGGDARAGVIAALRIAQREGGA